MKKIFNRHEIKFHLEGKDKILWEGKMERVLKNYLPRIQSNVYWIEKALEKEAKGEYEKVIINKLANIGYLANQAISDLTEE